MTVTILRRAESWMRQDDEDLDEINTSCLTVGELLYLFENNCILTQYKHTVILLRIHALC